METLDKGRIAHLFKLGIVSSLIALSADMILGWGVADNSLTGLDQYFSRYLTVSDTRIVLSAVLGMIGITVETLCYFGVYRLIASRSEKTAHAYRAGLIGMTAFGPFTHVMCCASIYHLNAVNKFDPTAAAAGAVKFILCFLLPVTAVFLPFFLTVAFVQFKAFLKNETPYPKWCCIFSILSGLPVVLLIKLIGNYPAVYAISTGWISIGSLIAFSGLLINMKKAEMCSMDEQQYRMTLTDVQWWCCDIPGNIGWIIWIVCNVKALIEGVDLYAILMLLPTALMLIGVVELISERIAKLDRILPRLRLYRGFGSLTLGGILGVPMAIAVLVMKTGGSRSWWMLAGAVLCGVFAGLCFAGYKRIEN